MDAVVSFSGDFIFAQRAALTTWAYQGWCGQCPKHLMILPGGCLESLLSGWQENGICCHTQHLISLCLAASFSAVAAGNSQMKYNTCRSQPCATERSCTLSVHLRKLLKYVSGSLLGG